MFEDDLIRQLRQRDLKDWAELLQRQLAERFCADYHGDFPKWNKLIQQLPIVTPSVIDLNADAIKIGESSDIDNDVRLFIESQLISLQPWRKGPFNLFGIHIDTEWRSDWKWQRLHNHIQPLAGKLVLDIGCGNGYHCWRMAGAGAELVIGIDPTLLYAMQFRAIQHYIKDPRVHLLPIGIEELPAGLDVFDSLFSMGILYHRRSPIDHLFELKNFLKPGGELILETLVIEGDANTVLTPEDRYAQMRNVWFIPSCAALINWLQRCGYQEIKLIHLGVTSIEEQRATQWMRYQSLVDFLDPGDPGRTVEGYAAPCRALVRARRD